MNKSIILTFLTVAISYSPLSLSKEMKSQNENIKTILNNLVSSNEPGLQYVVVDKASVLFESSIGLSDVKPHRVNLGWLAPELDSLQWVFFHCEVSSLWSYREIRIMCID